MMVLVNSCARAAGKVARVKSVAISSQRRARSILCEVKACTFMFGLSGSSYNGRIVPPTQMAAGVSCKAFALVKHSHFGLRTRRDGLRYGAWGVRKRKNRGGV